MSYSRWGSRGSGHWYTYWCCPHKGVTEDRNNAIFAVSGTVSFDFSAQELREHLEECLEKIRKEDAGDLEELKIYIAEFLSDIDAEYPLTKEAT